MRTSIAHKTLISVDEDKCVNCHACISACPVKFCNDGSGDIVKVNNDMCIGCGNCIEACTHDARYYNDDLESMLLSLEKREKVVAIVAPSIATNFPENFLKLNTWLKKQGVEAIFDVSFGAELTVKSYIEHLKKDNPQTIISQPCPAIVNYIQLYKPELLKYLVPADSPMLHSIKMIKKYYPQYKDHKIAAISPCLAKKKEFSDTGYGDFNVGMKTLNDYLENNNINLDTLDNTDFDNPPAERAVLFSSPGGLLDTAQRIIPDVKDNARKIEGVSLIYDYLEKLPIAIEEGKAPLIVDCLNCDFGCNAGPLTLVKDKPLDEIEYFIARRKDEMKQAYKEKSKDHPQTLEETINRYWEEGLYKRKYSNNWKNVQLKYPNKEQLQDIFHSMHKYSEKDIFNCTACGYNKCEKMAVAIFNNLNRAENCHFYLSDENERSKEELEKKERRLHNILATAHDGFIQIDNEAIIADANYEMRKILKKNDLVGRSLFDFLDKDNIKIIKEQLKRRKKREKGTYELALTQSDGNKIACMFSASPLMDEQGKKIGSFAMVSDITELKAAQQELKDANKDLENKVAERTKEISHNLEEMRVLTEVLEEHNQQLEKLTIVASEIDNAVLIMDKDGVIEWVNEGFRKLFGKTVEEMKGKSLITENTPTEIKKVIIDGIKNKKPVTYEFPFTGSNGKDKKWIQTTITPLYSDDGRVKKIIGIDSDITLLKQKETEILQQKEEIESQRDEIASQRDYLRSQTKKITQSINYARRIQNALLPPDEVLEEILPDYFIYFKPRDIVSGDFYWATKKEGHLIIAAVDCTGHGVPGALMSALGISFLNEIIINYFSQYGFENLQANYILNALRENVKNSLRQTSKDSESKDGMDISLVVINEETLECQFAGAHNPLIMIRDGELTRFRGDRMPIGIYYREKETFTNQTIQLQKDDLLYLFSDGMIDQFSETTGRKFMMKNFKELLLRIHQLPMEEQVQEIDSAFWDWKGTFEQVDDVLVIGLRI